MKEKTVGSVHWSFWVISAVTLIWNLMGSINFFMQMNPDMLTAYRESERAIIQGRPAWATVGFAIAVFGGTLGCLLLLLRKSAATYLFSASLLGVVVSMIHTVGVARSTYDFSPYELSLMTLMPLAVAAFLIWYSRWAQGKGWIG